MLGAILHRVLKRSKVRADTIPPAHQNPEHHNPPKTHRKTALNPSLMLHNQFHRNRPSRHPILATVSLQIPNHRRPQILILRGPNHPTSSRKSCLTKPMPALPITLKLIHHIYSNNSSNQQTTIILPPSTHQTILPPNSSSSSHNSNSNSPSKFPHRDSASRPRTNNTRHTVNHRAIPRRKHQAKAPTPRTRIRR